MKIRGNTVGTTMPRPDWEQIDPRKADYIKNKPDLSEYVKDAIKQNPESVKEVVEDWLNEHPEATTTVADGSITVEKLAAYKGKIVRNMFGNMGIKFGTYDDTTHIFTEDENSMHFAAFTKLEPSKKYYMQRNAAGVLANIAPLTMFFYDAEGTFLKNSYSWDSTFTTPENTAYGIYYVKSMSNSQRKYSGQPLQLLDDF